jgi:hypothetical protein
VAVWLPRSAILLCGMTNDGGVRFVDDEYGVPVVLGGGASVDTSSVACCSSVRSRWGRRKWRGSREVDGGETLVPAAAACSSLHEFWIGGKNGGGEGHGMDLAKVGVGGGGRNMGGVHDFWIGPV